jgi:hypothetical protein
VLLGRDADDALGSADTAERITGGLAAANHPHEFLNLSYPDAGHDLSLPNVPTSIRSTGSFVWGGTAAGAAGANAEWWSELAAFLDRHLCAENAC